MTGPQLDGHYIYGVTAAGSVPGLSVPDGVQGAPVSAVEYAGVAAVVSTLRSERVRSSRRDLSAHQRVVEWFAGLTTILPLQFGVVMPGRDAVLEDFLVPFGHQLSALLVDFRGKQEFRLVARYVSDAALREVVSGTAGLRRLQKRLHSGTGIATYHDRIEIGRHVAQAFERRKWEDATKIADRLGRHADSVVMLPAEGADVAAKAAFLVDRAAVDRFDRAAGGLALDFSGSMRMELVGPLAPWDFVALDPDPCRGDSGVSPFVRSR